MTEPIALEILEEYFKKHKYNPKRLDPNDFDPGTKVPDFEIKEGGKVQFLCELKSPNLHINKQTGLFQWTTTVSKLRDMLHKAVKQFNDCDPDHTLPRMLVFTSDHMQLNWTSLTHTLNGVVGFRQTMIKDLRNTGFIKRTNSDLEKIDFIVWCQTNSKDKRIYQYVPFINNDSKHFEKVNNISNKLKPIEEDDIVNKNTKKYK